MNESQHVSQDESAPLVASSLETLMNWVRQQERIDGVRFVWNYWPASRTDEGRLIVPLAVFCTPAKPRPDLPTFTYDPLYCGKCRGILNPFCKADLRAKSWTCCFCSHRNGFPLSYTGISEDQYPAEMASHFSTIEYALPRSVMPPIILFVVDTCIDGDELEALKESLLKCLASLPKSTFVGLITFGRNVAVHDFGMTSIKHSFVLRGTKYLSAKELSAQLGIGRHAAPVIQQPQETALGNKGSSSSAVSNRFLLSFEACQQQFLSSVKSISKDPWSTSAGRRPLRCTGVALNIAVSLLETSFPGAGGRVLLFMGGPCTEGPGKVVGEELKTPIRSHKDIAKNNAPFVQSATKYYMELSTRAVSNAHSIDIFSCALDQTGLHEMKSCCNITGGQLLLADAFCSSLFSQNLELIFAFGEGGKQQVLMNASIEVKASRNIKVSGCMGPCVSEKTVNEELVSDVDIMGTGGTTTWKCCSLTPNTTMCFFYETTGHDIPLNVNDQLYLQYITSHQHPSGQRRIRVTTVTRSWVDMKSQQVSAGFDQEAAATVLARLAVAKLEAEITGADVQRWLDKTLIRLCNRFGSFVRDDPNSFSMSDHFGHFPAIIFHLRRSQLLQLSNTSPDESAFYRHCLCKQDVTSCMIMIQPVLYAYSLQGPPTFVTLDSRSLQPDRILLLDTFFHLVIYRGQTIMQWIQAGYDRIPEYANLAHLIQAPVEDAQLILSTRFPMPRYVVTEQDGSQARFLLSKVNPSQTQSSYDFAWSAGQNPDTTSVLTDDVSLQVFIEHLRKLAVSSSV